MDDATLKDTDIYQRIQALVAEEHELRDANSGTGGSDAPAVRRIEEALDQCWDLLRQRRALRETGGDPSAAHVRPVDEVEGYLN